MLAARIALALVAGVQAASGAKLMTICFLSYLDVKLSQSASRSIKGGWRQEEALMDTLRILPAHL